MYPAGWTSYMFKENKFLCVSVCVFVRTFWKFFEFDLQQYLRGLSTTKIVYEILLQ